jgi:hypothetical protein
MLLTTHWRRLLCRGLYAAASSGWGRFYRSYLFAVLSDLGFVWLLYPGSGLSGLWKSMKLTRVLDTYIDINAPPERVWEVLIDFPAWKQWNPFIPSVTGKLALGSLLHITVAPPGLKAMEFKPEVFAINPGREILWGGSFLLVLYRGDHSMVLEPLSAGRTRFRQRERFRGPIVLFMNSLFKPTEQGYHQMNQALKQRVEGQSWKTG